MPYITQNRRRLIAEGEEIDLNAGDLNYIITKTCHLYLSMKGESYQTYNDIMGVLEGAKLELYRRKIASYEDIKIKENGDV